MCLNRNITCILCLVCNVIIDTLQYTGSNLPGSCFWEVLIFFLSNISELKKPQPKREHNFVFYHLTRHDYNFMFYCSKAC